jgi:hemoglobin-like flavoprotein
MDKEIIDEIKRSYGRALSNKNLMDDFYDKLIGRHPEIANKFAGIDLKKQQEVLKQSLSMAILFPQDNLIATHAMNRVRGSHSRDKLNVNPALYQHWLDAFMSVMSESDPEFTPLLEEHWRAVLSHVLDHIKSGY